MTSRSAERKLGNPAHQGLPTSDSTGLSISTNTTNCKPRSWQVANKQLLCFADRASWYNSGYMTNLIHNYVI